MSPKDQYIKNIKLMLPFYEKEEKQFLNSFKKSLDEYEDENKDAQYDDYIQQFGDIKETVYGYLDSKDEDFILKKMKLRQLFKRCMIVILTLFIIATAWFCYLLYLGYEDSINSDIDEIEVTITENWRNEE